MKHFLIYLGMALAALNVSAAVVVDGPNLADGKPVAVQPGKLGTVVVFMSAKCPCSNSHVGILRDLAKEFHEFNFVGVHSNGDEPSDMAKSYFTAAQLPFPVIEDHDDKLADRYKAFKTPHAFVVAADGKTVFMGGVTDSHEGPNAEKNYLKDALNDLRAGRAVKVSQARTLGCAISRGAHGH